MNTVLNFNGTLINGSKIKAIKLNPYKDLGPINIIVFELHSNIINVYDNEIKHWSLKEKNEQVKIKFPSHEIANANFLEFKEIWEDFLKIEISNNNDKIGDDGFGLEETYESELLSKCSTMRELINIGYTKAAVCKYFRMTDKQLDEMIIEIKKIMRLDEGELRFLK